MALSSRILVEHPVELAHENGQVLHGWIELLLATEAGWIVIDHKSSPRPRSEWVDEAIGHSGQLAAYASGLTGAGLKCAWWWVHLPVGGARWAGGSCTRPSGELNVRSSAQRTVDLDDAGWILFKIPDGTLRRTTRTLGPPLARVAPVAKVALYRLRSGFECDLEDFSSTPPLPIKDAPA